MRLAAGTSLGSYEILEPIGAGGMGEVYRARDRKLDRVVAVKVLPRTLSRNAEALSRFEREAKAIASLSHPGILSIFDFGVHEGAPFAVMELLEGETLRQRMKAGTPSVRKALEWGAQVARALAAAHAKGIVHRDLKPENLFVLKDGRIKVLDFGLARQTVAEEVESSGLPTEGPETSPGTVLGTVGYMAPEQVKGAPADARADVFSLGCVLYEVLSGKRAFLRETAAETQTAILREEPEDLLGLVPGLSPAVARVVRRCLEKAREERFQSASDLAFQLEALGDPSSAVGGSGATLPLEAAPARVTARLLRVGLPVAVLLAGAGLFWAGRATAPRGTADGARFSRLTFRRGTVLAARFVPGGQSAVYSAAWEGRQPESFEVRLDSRESRPLGFPGLRVAAVSAKGELALLEGRGASGPLSPMSTLVRGSLGGTEASRPIAENILAADFSPDGRELAVAHVVNGVTRVEYPLGTTLFECGANTRGIKVSPLGDRVAFWDTSAPGRPIRVVDREKRTFVVPGERRASDTLAWSPSADELLAMTGPPSEDAALRAVDLEGRERLLYRGVGSLRFHDALPDGRLLLEARDSRGAIAFQGSDGVERDLSWLSSSHLEDLSADGQTLLFTEGRSGSFPSGVFLRRTDGSPAMRLGEGSWPRLSPDGRWVAAIGPSRRDVALYPTGTGETRSLKCPDTGCARLEFLADGSGLLVSGPQASGTFVAPLSGGTWKQVAKDVTCHTVSPDGARFAGVTDMAMPVLVSLRDGTVEPLPGGERYEVPIHFDAGGKALYVTRRLEIPTPVLRVELPGGTRTLWKTLGPADQSGVSGSAQVVLAPEADAWAYGYTRVLSSTLYLAEGLR